MILKPILIDAKKFTGCRDKNSLRIQNLEDIKTETDQDSPKGFEIKTKTMIRTTHWLGLGRARSWKPGLL